MDNSVVNTVAPQEPNVTPGPSQLPPNQSSLTSSKRAQKSLLLTILLAIILIVGAGYGAYRLERSRAIKVENAQRAEISSLQTQVSSLQQQVTAAKKATTTSPAATGDLVKYTFNGVSFSYPKNWTLKTFTTKTGPELS